MRRIMAISTVTLLLLSGCGGSDEPEKPQAGQAATKPLPSGIVLMAQSSNLPHTVLFVQDVVTGEALAGANLPDKSTLIDRQSFDATLSRYTYVEDCQIRVATLVGDTFTDSASWTVPQGFGAGEKCYRQPGFDTAGRIRAVVDIKNHDNDQIVSVDPAAPEAAPKDEGVEAESRESKRYGLDGLTDGGVTVWSKGDDVVLVEAWGRLPGSDAIADMFTYRCPTLVDAGRWLCQARSSDKEQYFGGVALLTLGSTGSMRQLAPRIETEIEDLFLGPDGKTVAIHDPTGWYTTTLDGMGTPSRSPMEDDDRVNSTALFWY